MRRHPGVASVRIVPGSSSIVSGRGTPARNSYSSLSLQNRRVIASIRKSSRPAPRFATSSCRRVSTVRTPGATTDLRRYFDALSSLLTDAPADIHRRWSDRMTDPTPDRVPVAAEDGNYDAAEADV